MDIGYKEHISVITEYYFVGVAYKLQPEVDLARNLESVAMTG